MSEQNVSNYNFSLFRPLNSYNKRNRNIIITTLAIWAVAVFGFQVLLRAIEKPTPEQSLLAFHSVVDKVHGGTADAAEMQVYMQSLALVGSKLSLKDDAKEAIVRAFSAGIYEMLDETEGEAMSAAITNLSETREKMGKADKGEFLQYQQKLAAIKADINAMVSARVGYESTDLFAALVPYLINAQ
jgi:hypothetical protein